MTMFEKLAEKMTLKVTVSNHTLLRIMVAIVAFIVGVNFIQASSSALTLLFVSFFFALALNPPVSFLSRRLPGNSRGLATAISYLVVIGVIGSIAYATIPPLVNQTRQFVQNLPQYVDDIKNGDNFASKQVDRFQLEDDLEGLQSQLSERLGAFGGPVFSLLQRITANIVTVLTVLVLTFFMLVEGPAWMERGLLLQPKGKREHRKELAAKMYRVVTGYVNGQLLVAFIASVSALTMMSLLKAFGIDIPFIIPMATIIFITGLIPLIGNTLGALVVVTVALFESAPAALIMLVFFLIYQQIENNAIQPVVQARAVDLSPLMVLVAAIFGVTLAGFLGALLAIPIAGCLRVILNDYFERRHIQLSEAEA